MSGKGLDPERLKLPGFEAVMAIADRRIRPLAMGEDIKHCPHCGSYDVVIHVTSSTLLGWSGEGYDPNHVWHEGSCSTCGETFGYSTRSQWCWYSDAPRYNKQRVVIDGAPACFEDGAVRCECGDVLVRSYRNLEDSDRVGFLTSDHSNYRTFWSCATCGQRVEVIQDYFDAYDPRVQREEPTEPPPVFEFVESKIVEAYITEDAQNAITKYLADDEENKEK